jgi:hypothetical protein
MVLEETGRSYICLTWASSLFHSSYKAFIFLLFQQFAEVLNHLFSEHNNSIPILSIFLMTAVVTAPSSANFHNVGEQDGSQSAGNGAVV